MSGWRHSNLTKKTERSPPAPPNLSQGSSLHREVSDLRKQEKLLQLASEEDAVCPWNAMVTGAPLFPTENVPLVIRGSSFSAYARRGTS